MPSEEALWTVEFQTAHGWTNGGVVVLETDRVFGGDSQYYYSGKYVRAQPGMVAEVRVTHYHDPVGTAWGDDATSFEVVLRGALSADGNQIDGTIERKSFPSSHFRMTKREHLP